MDIDSFERIRYGVAYIKEHPEWRIKYPLGPVHWDVWLNRNDNNPPIQVGIPANEISAWLVSQNLLIQW